MYMKISQIKELYSKKVGNMIDLHPGTIVSCTYVGKLGSRTHPGMSSKGSLCPGIHTEAEFV